MSNAGHKTLIVIGCSITTPPLPGGIRRQVGHQLRKVQAGASLSMPISRPMPQVGSGVHELRLSDDRGEWRVVYHVGVRAVRVVAAFPKKTQATPKGVIEVCRNRLANNPE